MEIDSDILIRPEVTRDRLGVHELNEEAFGRPNEADLVDALRKNARPYISLVAEDHGQVVGHIFFSPVTIEEKGSSFTAMGLAPMAVLQEYQHQGVGAQLIRQGLAMCQRMGHNVVVVVGHPKYYPRFGFVPASTKGLRCEYPAAGEAFMVAELTEGALAGRTGLVKFRPEFAEVG